VSFATVAVVINPTSLDLSEELAERRPSAEVKDTPWRPATDITRELARLGPHLTGLADELRERLTDPSGDPS
jgi:hypothetical protein